MLVWLKKWLVVVLGGSATVAPAPALKPVALDELLTFECAKHVAEIGPEDHQMGPVFQRGGLILTSISTTEGSRILLLSGGAGFYSTKLPSIGVNRLRFTIPTGIYNAPRPFFLAYLHGGSQDSRLFELAAERPPEGREETDYVDVKLSRAENLIPHFEYAIFETLERTVNQITNKRIGRGEIGPAAANFCEHISRRQPSLGRTLQYDLNLIAELARGPVIRGGSVAMVVPPAVGGRGPASLPAN